MQKEKMKSRLKCRYFVRIQPNGGFERTEEPGTRLMYDALFISRLTMDYMSDDRFWVDYEIIKNKEDGVFRGKAQRFDSCIDAMVWYEDWRDEARKKCGISN